MSSEISTKWGEKAHKMTNQLRTDEGKLGEKELLWSQKLHTIAYQRGEEVAKGIIPFGQSNFNNLMLQMRSLYSPKYDVTSLAEYPFKIQNAGYTEDYIEDWKSSLKFDHMLDIKEGEFNESAMSVYFVEGKNEIIFTQLFAWIEEATPDA